MSTEFDMTCFSKGASPETTLNPDLWDDSEFLPTALEVTFAY